MTGYTAVVTGAGSGIGAATARLLSSKGWSVVLVGRNIGRLEAVARELSTPTAVIAGDLRGTETIEHIQKLITSEVWRSRPLAGLVNNAGIIHRLPFKDTSDEIWKENFETNLLAPVRLTRALLKHFSPGVSSIVNVSSTLGLKPIATTSAYSATKSALINWSECLALEVAPDIRVNCICPGLVDTPIHPFNKDDNKTAKDQAHAAQPMKRMGTSDEIANMIEFLMSEKSAWTTGSVISVDGGIRLN